MHSSRQIVNQLAFGLYLDAEEEQFATELAKEHLAKGLKKRSKGEDIGTKRNRSPLALKLLQLCRTYSTQRGNETERHGLNIRWTPSSMLGKYLDN